MNIFLPRFLCLFFFFTGFFNPVLAGSASTSSSFPAGAPIDTKMDLGLFGFLGGGMTYSVGGKPISRNEDFKKLIYPLHDLEASDLIREAEELHLAAWICYVSGGISGLDVALAFKPVPLVGVDWIDRISTGVVASEVLVGLGALLDNSSEGRKYNAVQRYNKVLRKEDQAFLDLKPQLYFAQQGPGLGLSCDF